MTRPLSILCLLGLLILSACANDALHVDDGLFTGEPCQAPCWQNLTPGQSTSADVDRFLSDLSLSDWPVRKVYDFKSGCRLTHLADRSGEVANALVNLQIENGVLTYVQSAHANMPRLKQVVDQFGPPEYVKAVSAIGPDSTNYFLDVYYPKLGLAFHLTPSNHDTGYIKPNMEIGWIEYFAPGDLLSYFTVRASCDSDREETAIAARETISKYVQPWPGFGEVTVIPSR